MTNPKILCVVGPTACGKTKMGVLLAKRFHGEVVSVDSMQIYRGMTVGTAAPTVEEMEGIPHHMVGIAEPEESWSVARFVEEADRCIQDILSRGKLPILVGGTGLYLDAIIAGRSFAGGSAEEALRRQLQHRLETEGAEALRQELLTIDPPSGERIAPADEKRLLRALEVYYATGKTITQHNLESQQIPPRYDALWVGLAFQEREDMKRRIDERVDAMATAGLLEEAEALYRRGLPETSTARQAIGYKELIAAIEGNCTREVALEEVKLRSRQYAKRQLTWLRRNPKIFWVLWEKDRNFAVALQEMTKYLLSQGLQ